jgi:hypothetical protein
MVAYFVEGFGRETLIASFLPLIVLIVLYVPVARLIGKAVLMIKNPQ